MALSEERIDELLSGFRDESLSADERSQVERLLDKDENVMVRWNEMRSLGEALKQISVSDSVIRLDSGFADRVMQAAVTRARDEGVADEHPLVRVAEQPMVRVVGSSNANSQLWRRVATVAVGIAATVAIAFVVTSSDDSNNGLAQLENRPSDIDGRDLSGTPNGAVRSTEGAAEASALNPLGTDQMEASLGFPATTDQLVDSMNSGDTQSVDATAVQPGDVPESAMIASAVDSNRPTLGGDTPDGGQSPLLPIPAITSPAITSPAITSPAITSSAAKSTVGMSSGKTSNRLSILMVLDVRRTDLGRSEQSVRRAMRLASLTASSQHDISEGLAESAASAVGVSVDESVGLMFLEGPSKKIDDFYLNLFKDEAGIASVSFALAMDAPMLAKIDEGRVDPTTIRHDGNGSVELVGDQEMLGAFIGQLDALNFSEMERDASLSMPLSNGPDELAQLLVVIR